jgi:hypothetical protein
MDTKGEWITHIRKQRSQEAQRKKRWTKHTQANTTYTEIRVTQVNLENSNPGDTTDLVETIVHRKIQTHGNPETIELIEKTTKEATRE